METSLLYSRSSSPSNKMMNTYSSTTLNNTNYTNNTMSYREKYRDLYKNAISSYRMKQLNGSVNNSTGSGLFTHSFTQNVKNRRKHNKKHHHHHRHQGEEDDNIQINIIKRPLLDFDQRVSHGLDVVTVVDATHLIVHSTQFNKNADEKYINHVSFTFDHVYDENDGFISDDTFTHDIVAPCVSKVLRGELATCILYGHSLSGKTYTFREISSLVANQLFHSDNNINKLHGKVITMSIMELNGDSCYDLLNDYMSTQLLKTPDHFFHPYPLIEIDITSAQELQDYVKHALHIRTEYLTKVSKTSSANGHTVLRIYVHPHPSHDHDGQVSEEGILTIVDLGGFDHKTDYENKSEWKKEVTNLVSLLNLVCCVREKDAGNGNGPMNFRQNLLSMLLKASFTLPDSLISLLITISPDSSDTEKTIHVLKNVSMRKFGDNGTYTTEKIDEKKTSLTLPSRELSRKESPGSGRFSPTLSDFDLSTLQKNITFNKTKETFLSTEISKVSTSLSSSQLVKLSQCKSQLYNNEIQQQRILTSRVKQHKHKHRLSYSETSKQHEDVIGDDGGDMKDAYYDEMMRLKRDSSHLRQNLEKALTVSRRLQRETVGRHKHEYFLHLSKRDNYDQFHRKLHDYESENLIVQDLEAKNDVNKHKERILSESVKIDKLLLGNETLQQQIVRMNLLEKSLYQKISFSVSRIHKMWKRFLFWKRLHELAEIAQKLKKASHLLSVQNKKRKLQLSKFATCLKIQKWWRGYQGRQKVHQIRRAIQKIHEAWHHYQMVQRWWKVLKWFWKLYYSMISREKRWEQYIKKLKQYWKTYCQRNAAARVIQLAWLAYLKRKRWWNHNAQVIQTAYRRYRHKKSLTSDYEIMVLITIPKPSSLENCVGLWISHPILKQYENVNEALVTSFDDESKMITAEFVCHQENYEAQFSYEDSTLAWFRMKTSEEEATIVKEMLFKISSATTATTPAVDHENNPLPQL